MKTLDFINANIGKEVIITGDGDLAIYSELKPLIFNKTKLILLKLTKRGDAYLTDGKLFYSVPPRNVRLATDIVDTEVRE